MANNIMDKGKLLENSNIYEIKNSISDEAQKLESLISKLRSPEGCPWDKELEIDDCAEYILEETYEAIEAIDKNDMEGLSEELGDILSQIFMISQIAKEKNMFNISQVFNGICEKLIFRHPHVFSDKKAENLQQVLQIWNEQKLKEKKERKNTLEGIPKDLPSIYILTKLFRKLQHYPDIFNILQEYILNSFNDLQNKFTGFLSLVKNNIFEEDPEEKNKEKKDNNSYDDSIEDFLSEFLLILTFYSYLKGIDLEKILRENTYKIIQLFEKKHKGN